MSNETYKNENQSLVKGTILTPDTFVGKTDTFTLCNLGANEVEGAAICLANAFVKEAIVSWLEISWDDFYRFAELFCKKTVNDNLSVVAKDSKGDVVGVVINEDLTPILDAINKHIEYGTAVDPLRLSPAGIEYFLKHERFIPIFELLDAIEMQHVQQRIAHNNTGKCLHIFMVAVEERCQAEGLSLKMIHRGHLQAKNSGFVYSIGECTNLFSQIVFKKLGGEVITEIIYDDFTIVKDGQTIKPFAGVNEAFTKQRNIVAKLRHRNKHSAEPFKELKNCAYSLELIQVNIKKA